MILKSIKEYAADLDINPRTVLKQIDENRLPKGVKAKMIGEMGYIISLSKTKLDKLKSGKNDSRIKKK